MGGGVVTTIEAGDGGVFGPFPADVLLSSLNQDNYGIRDQTSASCPSHVGPYYFVLLALCGLGQHRFLVHVVALDCLQVYRTGGLVEGPGQCGR